MSGSDISLRDPFQKQVTFTSSPAKLLLERQTTEFHIQSNKFELPELHRAKTCGSIRKSRKTRTPPVRKIFPVSEFTLLRQPGNEETDFDLYDERDLPFLDRSTEVGRMVSRNIVQSSLDDDVMTDDDMIECANRVLSRELDKAIK